MKYEQALKIAQGVAKQLEPHCERIAIAGSIRRKKPEVGDIEIVAIPHPYNIGLFESGIATVVNQWPKVKGELPCKYTQRLLPEGIKLDLFFAEKINWGLIYAIRTGSADFSHKTLAATWVAKGYNSKEGMLVRRKDNRTIAILEESQLFDLIGLKYVKPEDRK